ncbi:hypothetical protein RRG08_017630 [Elysia crispata]|uniref:Uncharacterized protein n=1 Tax=Elysia crispata TaxID=231223 RepID=A0AAE0ZDR7_9GAST|nr:hypothetical protein RRG08_017630 [Elysia crispata]
MRIDQKQDNPWLGALALSTELLTSASKRRGDTATVTAALPQTVQKPSWRNTYKDYRADKLKGVGGGGVELNSVALRDCPVDKFNKEGEGWRVETFSLARRGRRLESGNCFYGKDREKEGESTHHTSVSETQAQATLYHAMISEKPTSKRHAMPWSVKHPQVSATR